ncbi:Ethanolamine utilization protein EutH [Caldicellulosiruptor hydrothermalis 108]|uniref:Ethanolamine utilization protein EutH n=1 Tax=Caldicellulosiruptor hydrothermalis (strain DSM 18901 / VKM B-2411 / 108) TaxID=632292 RepID=E4QCI0_CALH1|nr:ethanolamine utilization protein EutH [Caldicellulosiruptor hydrothermalis]ADQ06276.1 Ethanolamine utilization protein EutH [Caldicellulosiruptor hydrothermalis 108]
MQLSKILFMLFSIAFATGVIDKIFGDKLKLGSKIEEGFIIMAKAVFSMLGILYLYPFLGMLLVKPSKFLAQLFHTDSAILISCFLPIDMGGYHISQQVSKDEMAKVIGGILLSSNLGATIGFTYPVAFGILKGESKEDFIKGSLIGIGCIPIAVVFTSMLWGYNVLRTLKLVAIVVIVTFVLAIGVSRGWRFLITAMKFLGSTMTFVNLVGLALLGYHILTSKALFPIKTALQDCIVLPLKMAVLIGGSYVFFTVIYNFLINRFRLLKGSYTLNQAGLEGMLMLLVNCVPTLYLFDKMDKRSKILASALCMTAASALGPQLAFVATFAPAHVSLFLLNKLISAAVAVAATLIYLKFGK